MTSDDHDFLNEIAAHIGSHQADIAAAKAAGIPRNLFDDLALRRIIASSLRLLAERSGLALSISMGTRAPGEDEDEELDEDEGEDAA